MSKSFEKKLSILMKAKFPIIGIESYEEKRVIPSIYRVAKKKEWECFVWTITNQLEKVIGQDYPEETSINDMALNNLLNEILTHKEKKAIYIFKDVDSLFEGRPDFIRRLRDIALKLPRMYKTVILLSPTLRIPQHLEKDITLLDFYLPGIEELNETLTRVLDSAKLSADKISISTELKEKILKATLGLTDSEAENIFAKGLVVNKGLSEHFIQIIIEEKRQIIKKTGILEFIPARESFKDVGGMDNLKEWLNKREHDFSEDARKFGLPNPKGVLLLGIPGCGKTLIAKSIGSQWKLPILRFDIGEVFSKYQGESESNIRKVIKLSESIAPCILWIDEIEKGFAGASSGGEFDSGTTSRIFGSFITWMQEKTKPVFIVATANKISGIPPELLRKGRFDEIFFVDLPDASQRKDIFKIHLNKVNQNLAQETIVEPVKLSHGFSGAEIEQVVMSSLHDAFLDNRRPLNTEDLIKSIEDTVPLSVTMKDKIVQMREWAKVRAVNASKAFFNEKIPENASRFDGKI